jgi:A/G-specific adenine glycosylase
VAHARGEADLLPIRPAKREGELRRGAAFVVRRADDCVLLRTRPPRGLLGGMTEVPTTAWATDFDEATALAEAPRFGDSQKHVAWRKLAGAVRHVFTHFPLELVVYRAELPRNTAAPAGTRWIAIGQLGAEALPSLMRKVVAHGLDASALTHFGAHLRAQDVD